MSDIELTREAWNQFLHALAPEPSRAGSRYEQLRNQLIALYRWRELPWPEDLADQALDHVACQLASCPGLQVDLAVYLQGIAHRIGDDARRRRRDEAAVALPTAPGFESDEPLARLCSCLDDLPRLDRRTLLEYETGTGQDRVRRRKALAAELGIPMNALRVRVFRLRARVAAMMRDEPAARREYATLNAEAARRRRLQRREAAQVQVQVQVRAHLQAQVQTQTQAQAQVQVQAQAQGQAQAQAQVQVQAQVRIEPAPIQALFDAA